MQFKQPALPTDPDQLKNKLAATEHAIQGWKDKRNEKYKWWEKKRYEKDIIEANIKFFKKLKNRIEIALNN